MFDFFEPSVKAQVVIKENKRIKMTKQEDLLKLAESTKSLSKTQYKKLYQVFYFLT